jgi:hypothetical protein
LIIGHENFAHHLWNELPALDAWLARASDEAIARLQVVAIAEPLGPLHEIFPKLAAASFTRTRTNLEIPLRVRLGSQMVTNRIRRIMLEYFGHQPVVPAVAGILQMLDSLRPRVWISVRHGARTADNQLEFLLTTVKTITDAYPRAAFVFDGFSFPIGFFDDERTHAFREVFGHRSRTAAQFIQGLKETATLELGIDASSMFDVSGLDLTGAVTIAGHCDYYICHGGTLQHKIGWFYSKPGFIHAAPAGIAHFLKQAQQAEGAVVPDALPADLASATTWPEGVQGILNIPRNSNYRILDVNRASEVILLAMRAHLQNSTENRIAVSQGRGHLDHE